MQKKEQLYQIEELDKELVIKPLEEWIQHQINDKGIPGIAITVTNRDKVLFTNVYHHKDLKTPPLSPLKTLFKVASVSKLFTYVALLQLVEKNKLSLNDPITKYIPNFKVANPPHKSTSIDQDLYKNITVFNLIRHTSGLIREPIEGNYFNIEQCNLEELVESMNKSILVNVPGTIHKYSNAAVAMAGYIIQKVSGISFEDYLENNIFKVIGMKDSTFRHENYQTRVEKDDQVRQAVGHLWKYWDETKRDLNVYTEAPLTHFGMFPAGCLKTTLPDISKFLQVFLNDGKPLLQEGTFLHMCTPQPLDRPSATPRTSYSYSPSQYTHGLGAEISNVYNIMQLRHGGAINGFSSDFRILPELGLGIYACSTLDCTNSMVNQMVEYVVQNVVLANQPTHIVGLDMPLLIKNNQLTKASLIAQPVDSRDVERIAGVYKYNDGNYPNDTILRDTTTFKIYQEYNERVYLRTQFISELSVVPGVTQPAPNSINLSLITNDRLSYLQQYNLVIKGSDVVVNGGIFKRVMHLSNNLIYLPYRPLPSVVSSPPARSTAIFEALVGHYEAKDQIALVFEEDGMLVMCIEWLFIYNLYLVSHVEGKHIEFRLATDSMYNDETVTIYYETTTNPKTGAQVIIPKQFSLAGIPFSYRKIGPVPGKIQEGVYPADQVTAIIAKSLTTPCPHIQPKTNGLVDLSKLSSTLMIDIKYASTDNFAGVQWYPVAKAYLHEIAAQSLLKAHEWLAQWGVGIIVYDAYRPWNITWAMSESVQPEYRGLYVADPTKGSVHNRGGAVDISLYDLSNNQVIQMSGEYDEFSYRSHRSYFGGTTRQRWFKKLLTVAMMNHGFTGYPQEHWHYDHISNASLPVLNVQLDHLS